MAAIADPKLPKSVPLEVRTSPSIGVEVEVMRVSTERSWMDPILSYIRDGILPKDRKQARKLKCRAARYTLLDGVLYRRGFTLPLLRFWMTRKQTMCWGKFMKEYAATTRGQGLCPSSHFGKGISSRLCTSMRRG